jgi:hypothetical protein
MTTIPAGPDVLTDPLFQATGAAGAIIRLPLPGLLARLLSGPDIIGFPGVAAEQRGHWWRFLVRCAAKALHERGWTVEQAAVANVAELEDSLRQALYAAAGDADGNRGIWALYQPDPARPGFLQPPTPDGAEPAATKYALNSASVLTSAIGSKNHERKVDVTRALDPEQTVYALIELQLGAIFGGRGNYPSQIMGSASGAGSGAPFMGVRLGTGENASFRHDVAVLLSQWDRIRGDHGLRGQRWALWTEPWDGESSLPSLQLDPAFIPLARLIRLGPPSTEDRFDTVWFRASNKPRIDDLSEGGDLGDPFTPRVPDAKNPDRLKVRGTLEGGYGYAEIANLLFGTDAKRPGRPSSSVQALRSAMYGGDVAVRVVFEGTAYEQGKTVGFYRREILMPPSVETFLVDPGPVREVHGELFPRVKDVKSALNGAARILLSGAPKPRDGDVGKITAPTERLEALVDRRYLDVLLDGAERHSRDDETWRADWARQLERWAIESFQDTKDTIPTATARRYEREVRALDWLRHRLRRLTEAAGGNAAAAPDPVLKETTV